MQYKARRGGSFSILAAIILLGVIGGIAGGAYFFVFADQESGVDDIPLQPPNFTLTQAAAQANGVSADTGEDADEDAVPAGQNIEFPYLLIPSAGVNEIIVTSYLKPDGWEIKHIRNRIGHLEGTSWLNQHGNIVLAAHVELSDGTMGAFARIDDMEIGDDVFISENGVEYRYRVTEIKTVEPDDLSVVYPPADQHEIVTLITCSDYNFISDTYDKRIVIVAERVEEG